MAPALLMLRRGTGVKGVSEASSALSDQSDFAWLYMRFRRNPLTDFPTCRSGLRGQEGQAAATDKVAEPDARGMRPGLSRSQTCRWKVSPYRTESTERGLEDYAWHLYGDRNFFGAAARKQTTTLTIGTNLLSSDDNNKLNFHLLSI
jgi:hypothetical protein